MVRNEKSKSSIFSQNKSAKDLQGIGKVPIFAVPKRTRDYEAQGRVRVIEEKKKKEEKKVQLFFGNIKNLLTFAIPNRGNKNQKARRLEGLKTRSLSSN